MEQNKRGKHSPPNTANEVLMATVVAENGEEAYAMKRKGMSIRAIAQHFETTPKTVYDWINTRMKTEVGLITAEERSGILQLELDRLDDLQAAHWESAMYGDPKSTEAVLKVMGLRHKLLNLDALDPETQRQQVLVVAGSEAEYLKALQQAAGQ